VGLGLQMDVIARRMTKRVDETFGRPNAAYVVAVCSGILIGVGVATHHWTDQHLLTGIGVVPKHQHRGVGRPVSAHLEPQKSRLSSIPPSV
jgi:hypothetical protein